MSVTVRVPTPLRNLTGGRELVDVAAEDVRQAVERLEEAFPGLRERLLDEAGSLRRFVNIYLNQEDIRFLDGLGTTLREGDEVSIIPAIAGG